MNFTEGKDLQYERLMRQKPRYGKQSGNTSRGRDCPHCLYWDEARITCKREICVVFTSNLTPGGQ